MADEVVIYSAIYGSYDIPKPLPDLGVPAILYSSARRIDAPGWQVRQAPITHISTPMLRAKWWKTHPDDAAPDTKVSIYVDGSVRIDDPEFVGRALDALGDDDWTLAPHPSRNDVYAEAAYSATLPRYDDVAAGLVEQADYYASIGHPAGWGLFATGVLVRRHTPGVLALGEHWWYECANRTYQDQVSLPVLLWLAQRDQGLRFNTRLGWQDGWTTLAHDGPGVRSHA
jgi:hypothetical protein